MLPNGNAREVMHNAVMHIELAAAMALLAETDSNVKVKLAVVVVRPDGSGRMTMTMDLEPFIADLKTILEAVDP